MATNRLKNDKQDLLDKFLEGGMDNVEISSFSRKIKEDNELRNALEFELMFRDALHNNRKDALINKRRVKKFRKGLSLLILVGLLAGIAWLSFFNPPYFEKEEGQEKIEQFIESDARIQERAITITDRQWIPILSSPNDKNLTVAYNVLLQIIHNAAIPCDPGIPSEVYTYAGLIGLYNRREYERSLPLLECAFERDTTNKRELFVALVTAHYATGQTTAAMRLLQENEGIYSLADFPKKIQSTILKNR